MSTSSSPISSSPHPPSSQQQPAAGGSAAALPPINTSAQARQRMGKRQSSLAKDRMSTYSMASNASQKLSRPSSHLFPAVRSSLPYSQVRDFAYPLHTPMHYGPPAVSSAAPSGTSTPAFETQVRLGDLQGMGGGDPADTSWANSAWGGGGGGGGGGGSGGGGGGGGEQLPRTAYGGKQNDEDHGPPYSEDEDLQSPIVVSSRRRWSAEDGGGGGGPGSGRSYGKGRAYFAGVNGDGSETYYVGGMDEMADGPGGELVTYDTDDPRHSSSAMLSPDAYRGHDPDNRFSRDYQFSIASPDEEMHGKAVALFDFERENENELPLAEGQVIWVSYRHGQGWLVAEDPKTRDTGLVPEAYVRLLRDIQGGLHYLSVPDGAAGAAGAAAGTAAVAAATLAPEPEEASPVGGPEGKGVASGDSSEASPTEQRHKSHRSGSGSNGEQLHHPPVLSTFSTSSKDLDPYPHPELASETGQAPPEIVGRGDTAPAAPAPAPAPAPAAKAGSTAAVNSSSNNNLASPSQPASVARKSSGRSTASRKGGGKARSTSRSSKPSSSKRNSTVR